MRAEVRNEAAGRVASRGGAVFPARKKNSHARARWRRQIIRRMTRVAVIEDDQPTSNQLAGWIRAARPGIEVRPVVQPRRRRSGARARGLRRGGARHRARARAPCRRRASSTRSTSSAQGTPVLVVSAMPATIYRSIMKALDAWDYLQKTTFEESDFIDTFLEILRVARERKAQRPTRGGAGRRAVARPAVAAHADLARRAHQPAADGAAHPRDAATARAAKWCRTTSSSTW